MNKIKLFCVPYAGGSAAIYKKWALHLDESIELVPIELAGRGKRIQEPMYENIEEAVEDIFSIIKNDIYGTYALFGHSMGAILIYELIRKIKSKGLSEPLHAFFSGRGVPNIKPLDEKKYYLLDDAQFKDKLVDLGGTPPQFFETPELMDFFLPLLRNDFKIASASFIEREVIPFNCEITILLGKEEKICSERIDSWKYHTKQLCSIYHFEGGHFFINHEHRKIADIINEKLRSYTSISI